MFLTLFTPTYNREKLLPRLYNSILDNLVEDIEWIIVDDGSLDDTRDLVSQWQVENKFPIKYIYQKNSGKHIAHNVGVMNATGELFFCIDSDDILSDSALDYIKQMWNDSKNQRSIGIVGFKIDFNGKSLSTPFPDMLSANYLDLIYNHKISGEYCWICKTDILKQNLFPNIVGNKFFTEAYIYTKIGLKKNSEYLLLNKPLNICEYQDDGYSRNLSEIIEKYPLGFKMYSALCIDINPSWIQRILTIINYHMYSRLCSWDDEYNYRGKYKILVYLMKPLGLAMYIRFKIKRRIN